MEKINEEVIQDALTKIEDVFYVVFEKLNEMNAYDRVTMAQLNSIVSSNVDIDTNHIPAIISYFLKSLPEGTIETSRGKFGGVFRGNKTKPKENKVDKDLKNSIEEKVKCQQNQLLTNTKVKIIDTATIKLTEEKSKEE
jgi:hypothetical protein